MDLEVEEPSASLDWKLRVGEPTTCECCLDALAELIFLL